MQKAGWTQLHLTNFIFVSCACKYASFILCTKYIMKKKNLITSDNILLDEQKFGNFKMGIGIAEKSHETRRDRWGGSVKHKSLL